MLYKTVSLQLLCVLACQIIFIKNLYHLLCHLPLHINVLFHSNFYPNLHPTDIKNKIKTRLTCCDFWDKGSCLPPAEGGRTLRFGVGVRLGVMVWDWATLGDGWAWELRSCCCCCVCCWMARPRELGALVCSSAARLVMAAAVLVQVLEAAIWLGNCDC